MFYVQSAQGGFMYAESRPASGSLAVFTLLALLGYAGRAEAQQAVGSFDRTLSATGPVELEVSSGSGRIEVRAGQPGRVEIRARLTAGDWGRFRSRGSAQEGVRRIEANPAHRPTGHRVPLGRNRHGGPGEAGA